jgi:hypothetical protein
MNRENKNRNIGAHADTDMAGIELPTNLCRHFHLE